MNYLIGIDTETTNGMIDSDNKLDLSQSLVYDVGWQVIDTKGKVYRQKSFVVAEIFLDPELMSIALFKDKIPNYWKEIKSGKRVLTSFYKIRKEFFKDKKEFNVKAVFAHNAFFDYRALNNTLRLISGSKYRWFFPYNLEVWDTLKMSRDIFSNDNEYSEYCNNNGYLTKHKPPQNKLTAEILYRFISGDNNFEESHTGLEDVEIETEILVYCLKIKKTVRKTLFN